MDFVIRILARFFDCIEDGEPVSLNIGAPSSSALPFPNPAFASRMRGAEGHSPHPENAAGPFYSDDGGCVSCGAPHGEAPQLVSWHEERCGSVTYHHCIFARQPSTADEVELAIQAMEVSCVENLRYRGNDEGILAKLRALRLEHLCDALDPQEPETTG